MHSSLINKLFSYPGRNIRSFDAMRRLDELLGRPHQAFRSIHIGGTNGKGSVSTKIAEALRLSGYKTGLYTSPHISSFQERIQINGMQIPESTAERLLETIFYQVDTHHLPVSFFDLLTALAFLYFAEEDVEYASIEVGLGGRLDATNVIDPILAVITSIGLEHTHLLGTCLEQIAFEKGAIAKPGVPFIAGPKAAPFFPQAIAAPQALESFYDYENRSIARTALEQLKLPTSAIEEGILIRPPCRFEILGDVILDAAHNPDAIQRLIDALEFHFPSQKFPFYLAFSQDKDWKTCLKILRPRASHIFFLRHSISRLVDPHLLAAHCPGSEITDSIGTGVVTGSFYIMDMAREQLLTSALKLQAYAL